MADKLINSRIQHKHDIEANWQKAENFSPKDGELIIYDVDESHDYIRAKVGDGNTNVNLLPFLISPLATINTPGSMSPEDKALLDSIQAIDYDANLAFNKSNIIDVETAPYVGSTYVS